MTPTSARAVVVTLTLWCPWSPALTEKRGCQSPDAKFLSRVDIVEEVVTFPNNASSKPQQSRLYPPGTRATYQCDPGFVLLGDTARVCGEARWSGAAPFCYLNVAERSSLLVNNKNLADGNRSSSKSLLSVFSARGDALRINLYFATRIKQVRVIADNKVEGTKMKLDFINGKALVLGTTADLKARVSSTTPAEFIAFESPGGVTADTLSVSLPGLEERFTQPHGVRLYQIQIVADSTGLSWRQCLDELEEGKPAPPTWALGNWCYHLIVAPPQDQEGAQRRCQRLGQNGTLYRPVAGLNRLIIDTLPDDLFRHSIRNKTRIWVHGNDNQNNEGRLQAPSARASQTRRCRVLSLDDTANAVSYADCDDRHPYLCQRAPRLCGRFPREAGLHYEVPERAGQLRGSTVDVSCGGRPGPTGGGHISCLAPGWTSVDFCRPAQRGGVQPAARPTPLGGHTGAIVGGAVGGVIVLAVLAVAVIRERNGWRQRQRRKPTVPSPDDNSDFLGLKPNPIYGDGDNEQEHLYSEVSNPEALYQECSHAAPAKRSSPEPPSPPATWPSIASPAAAVPDFDYEVLLKETAARQPETEQTALRNIHVTAVATPAPSVQIHSHHEPVPVEAQTPSDCASGPRYVASPSATPAALGNRHPPTLEYAVPLVAPDDSQRNLRFAERRTGGGSETHHAAAVGEDEAEYALPYRAPVADSARRGIPGMTGVAVGVRSAHDSDAHTQLI